METFQFERNRLQLEHKIIIAEVRLSALEVNVEIFAIQLRKLAAIHQSGTSIAEVKLQVDNTIQHMKDSLGKDKTLQALKWHELLIALEKFSRNTADPKWMLVIKHAKHRIKSRIQTAVYSRKRFNR
ncbi:hypothetical protein VH86_09180 [Pantoea sp. BL1]|uniref:hypothetical protein n=1 Tax=Pantoea sp. BL1 TaxID=1628190 RepID=UPI00061EEDEA|nr:hypothetical protein [Pantoea sp. BL1]KJV48769.1 hypothetical protein VH86_09180 [Pantoea sp. BL1]